VEDALRAYETGRADGVAARRDATRAADPATGADYRIGFLDGRIEVFHLHAQARRLIEDED
jgi:hypothetical protein